MPTVNLIAPIFYFDSVLDQLPYNLSSNIRLIKTPPFLKNIGKTLYSSEYDKAVMSQCKCSIEISKIDTYSQNPHIIRPSIYEAYTKKLFDILFSAWICKNMFQFYLGFIYKDFGPENKQEITMIFNIDGINSPYRGKNGQSKEISMQVDLENLKRYFNIIENLDENFHLRLPINMVIAALKTNSYNLRFLLFWFALESLFGTDQEIKFRISQRIAFFISNDIKSAKIKNEKIQNSYKIRSNIVHASALT